MKKRLLPIIIALCVLAAGCVSEAASTTPSASLSVYRVLAPEYRTMGRLLQAEPVVLSENEASVQQAAEALSKSPSDTKLNNPLPEDVKIIKTERKENTVNVYFDSAYLDISGIDKTLADACVTLTMCSIEGVDFVSIFVGSETIGSSLSSEDFLLFDSIISSSKAQVRIYFPKSSEKALGSEYRTVSFNDENSAEREILDALFDGPESSALKRAFPIGTIVTSVYTLEGVCSVSLSGVDLKDSSMTVADAKLAVYSVVNSLTSLSGIRSVQLLIDGNQAQSLWGFDISHALSRNENIIGSAVSG